MVFINQDGHKSYIFTYILLNHYSQLLQFVFEENFDISPIQFLNTFPPKRNF